MRNIVYFLIALFILGSLIPETDNTVERRAAAPVAAPAPQTVTLEKPASDQLEDIGLTPEKEDPFPQTVAAEPTQIAAPVVKPTAPVVKPPPPIIAQRFVTASALNMRDAPSTAGQVRNQVTYGTEIAVREDLGDWSKVVFNGQELWVASRYLSATKPVIAPAAAPAPTQTRTRTLALPTSAEIQAARNAIIRQSRASYAGSCPCPYDRDRGGRRCGGRSAWSRPGGASPICYDSDISKARLDTYLARLR